MAADEKSAKPTQVLKHNGDDRTAANKDDMRSMILGRPAQVVAKLSVVEGPGKGKSVLVYDGTNSVGRWSDAKNNRINRIDLDFGDEKISRHEHFFLNHENGKFELHDNNKPNPVRVNGQLVRGMVAVAPNDLIQVGDTSIRLEKN